MSSLALSQWSGVILHSLEKASRVPSELSEVKLSITVLLGLQQGQVSDWQASLSGLRLPFMEIGNRHQARRLLCSAGENSRIGPACFLRKFLLRVSSSTWHTIQGLSKLMPELDHTRGTRKWNSEVYSYSKNICLKHTDILISYT